MPLTEFCCLGSISRMQGRLAAVLQGGYRIWRIIEGWCECWWGGGDSAELPLITLLT